MIKIQFILYPTIQLESKLINNKSNFIIMLGILQIARKDIIILLFCQSHTKNIFVHLSWEYLNIVTFFAI